MIDYCNFSICLRGFSAPHDACAFVHTLSKCDMDEKVYSKKTKKNAYKSNRRAVDAGLL